MSFPALLRLLQCLLLCSAALSLHAAPGTEEVFERFKDRVVQVRVINLSAGSRIGYGSGFAVEGGKRLVTNYHVISRLVLAPKQHRIELRLVSGKTMGASLQAFDAIHDLAVLVPEQPLSSGFSLAANLPAQGLRVYSFGVPNDLDFTIVEGTNNGLIGYTFYDRVHYTGAINPGMSGGPAIDADGQLVGVNVAKEGDGVSFLVPASSVTDLLKQAPAGADRRAVLRSQLLAHQDRVMNALLAQPLPQHPLGRYRLPGQFASYLRCWGESDGHDKQRYKQAAYQCGNQDALFLDENFSTGDIALQHQWFGRGELGRLAFGELVNGVAKASPDGAVGNPDELGNFVCEHGALAQRGGVMRTALCLRSYRKLAGLYDLALKVARSDDGQEAVISSVRVNGVSRDNAMRFARRYVEAMQ
ncbi:serine protease [Chitinimonas sp.]|uniref:S1 family peptidase n=1 Tax=Chitinimonas sp. TaxID=1934313 RepID=UPI0035AD9E19